MFDKKDGEDDDIGGDYYSDYFEINVNREFIWHSTLSILMKTRPAQLLNSDFDITFGDEPGIDGKLFK